MRVIRAAEQARMPWKNGGGETVEVVAHPPGASTDGFGWRVSTAPMTSDGAFSVFDGVDRTLAVLDGKGVELDIDGAGAMTALPDAAPCRFAGDAPTRARLLAGPVLNLNAMSRRGAFVHRVERRVVAGATALGGEARWTVVLPRGAVRLEGEDSEELRAGDAVLLEAGDGPVRLVAARPVAVYVVAVDPA